MARLPRRSCVSLLLAVKACAAPESSRPSPTLASDPSIVLSEGVVQLRTLADLGDLRACQILAERLLTGDGMERSPVEARARHVRGRAGRHRLHQPDSTLERLVRAHRRT